MPSKSAFAGMHFTRFRSRLKLERKGAYPMRASRLKTILFLSFFLLTLFSIPITTRAGDNDDDDDYDVKARVVRISMLEGTVSLKHSDSKEWEADKVNSPAGQSHPHHARRQHKTGNPVRRAHLHPPGGYSILPASQSLLSLCF